MITEEVLLRNGYKKFDNDWRKRLNPDTYIYSYQKRLDNETGKKYFITLNLDDYFKIALHYDKAWSVSVQFYLSEEETFNVEYFVYNHTTIQMVEDFYEKMWNAMGCGYYEKWDED